MRQLYFVLGTVVAVLIAVWFLLPGLSTCGIEDGGIHCEPYTDLRITLTNCAMEDQRVQDIDRDMVKCVAWQYAFAQEESYALELESSLEGKTCTDVLESTGFVDWLLDNYDNHAQVCP